MTGKPSFKECKFMKIVASLTTTPNRINLILPTILSILNQTIRVDGVDVNIPLVFERTGEKYEVPEWLADLEESSKDTNCPVRIYRTKDYGAITKVAPTLMRYRNNGVYIWSLDDDFEYPVNMLAALFREFIPSKHRVLTHSCGHWTYDSFRNCTGFTTGRAEGVGDFLEGFASVLYPSSVIDNDFEDYINITSKILDNRNSDDIILSNYLKLKNVTIYNCGYPYVIAGVLLNEGLNYGRKEDALHHQGGGNVERYIRVFNWLQSMNMNAWSI
jgi:hypothetical protein